MPYSFCMNYISTAIFLLILSVFVALNLFYTAILAPLFILPPFILAFLIFRKTRFFSKWTWRQFLSTNLIVLFSSYILFIPIIGLVINGHSPFILMFITAISLIYCLYYLLEILIVSLKWNLTNKRKVVLLSILTSPLLAYSVHTALYSECSLSFAAKHNYSSFISIKMVLGHDPNESTCKSPPIFESANHLEATQTLIKNGADVNKSNEWGETALHRAAGRQAHTIAKALIAAGANVHAKNKSNITPLHRAVSYKKHKVAELLLAAGAKVNDLDNNLNTSLIGAVINDDFKMVKLLIEAGAKIDVTNKIGNSPLSIAKKHGVKEIIEVLE